MRVHSEARRDAYDVLIVGSGIGGLTSAALLAAAGRRVLVVERHDRVGGYAHAFMRRGFRFDAALHLVGGCGPAAGPDGGIVHRVLEALGVRDRCDFVRVDPCYRAVFPSVTLDAGLGVEAFVDAHAARFPREAAGLRRLLALCGAARHESVVAGACHGAGGDAAAFPTLARYRRATLGRVLDEHLDDATLKATLGALWPYLGLPPSRLSFVYWAAMLLSYVADGAYYCRGTFQVLADALADAAREANGEVLLDSVVRRIDVDDAGRATGVTLENGQRVRAGVVISNADARQTLEELVGREHLGGRWHAVGKRLRPSVSAFVVHVGTDAGLAVDGLRHENFFYATTDHDEVFAGALAGRPRYLTVTVPTLVDPSLAPTGGQVLVLTTLMAYDAVADWRREKARLVDELLALAETHVPGLRAHALVAEGSTPRTMERYTRNTAGALCGWELAPEQVGPARLGPETPVDGLYLAGHWSRPGGGVYGVVMSGVESVRTVLARAGDASFLRTRGL